MLALLNLAYANKVNFLRTYRQHPSLKPLDDLLSLTLPLAISENRVPLMIWHEADLISQLVCIGISVCRPLYKDWLNRVVDKVGTTVASASKSNTDTGHSGGGFSVIALQTIGGSSVNKGGGAKATAIGVELGDTDDQEVDGEIKVQRSWRVESDSRSVVLSGDATSEEHILGCSGSAEADPEDKHRRM